MMTVPEAARLPMKDRPVSCSSRATSSGGNPVSVKVACGSVVTMPATIAEGFDLDPFPIGRSFLGDLRGA